jgi:hypothetical protein
MRQGYTILVALCKGRENFPLDLDAGALCGKIGADRLSLYFERGIMFNQPTHVALMYEGPDQPESRIFVWGEPRRTEDGEWYTASESLDGPQFEVFGTDLDDLKVWSEVI